MTRPSRLVLTASALLLAFTPPAFPAGVPSPESHLGYRPGADFHLASWSAVADYFRKVDRASDRVLVRELGQTTEGRPFLVAAVSAPETIAGLKHYQALQHRLSDPRFSDPASKAVDPVAASKAVVVITCTIHSTETASTFMALELLHELATKDDEATRQILDKTILLLVPSVNPDGIDKVASWYERSKGHPWEGQGMPELYHPYAGHDTNRDWFMLNLKETRLLTRMLYTEWFPTILYDVHEMGSRGPRIFVPPFYDPINPNLDPRVHQGIFLIGAHMAADLAASGKRGVATQAIYDNWWNGGNRTTPQRHNIVAVLTEAARVRMATPVFIDDEQLEGDMRGFPNHRPAVNFVDPWPGGWWRLRDIVEYELSAAKSLLTLAARYKDQFQGNLAAMSRDAIARGEHEPPFAWVVPREQDDPGRAAEMVRILHDTGIEVRRAKTPFEAGGVTYPEGTWVLPAAQPYRAHLKDMMERQNYPSRLTTKGEAEPPYDVAGWTLPLLMGARAVAVDQAFKSDTERLDRIDPVRGTVSGAEHPRGFLLGVGASDDFRLLNALFDADVPVAQVERPDFPGGFKGQTKADVVWTFPATDESRAVLSKALPHVAVNVASVADESLLSALAGARSQRLKRPRVGLYQPWDASSDEGWTRLILERFQFPYVTLHNDGIRAGDLKDRFDAIVLPSVKADVIRSGYKPNDTEPAYVGGLNGEGADALRDFVAEGGTLVCLEDSCDYAIGELGLPVTNVLKGVKASEFYCPGSILRAEVVPDRRGHPVVSGMPGDFSAYFDESLAFDLPQGSAARAVVRYARSHPLESGWLLGPEKLQGKAALVEVPFGLGRVLLFGFPPQHRGQTHGTFRLLFNALLQSGMAPAQ